MDKKTTIKDRILTFLRENGINKADFYAKTGIEASNFKGRNKESLPGSAMLVKILTLYPGLSADWLLTGNGEMLKTKCSSITSPSSEEPVYEDKVTKNKPNSQIKLAEKLPEGSHEGIPLIPFSAMAGALTGEQTALEYECERYVVPAFKGADFLMPVKGNSMTPTYVSGDIVACQRVPMSDLFFQWNKPYVLDTTQGPLIKRIKPGTDAEHIRIISDNTEYDPYELPISAIHAVALVIGIIRLE